jgi:hypothetical protein
MNNDEKNTTRFFSLTMDSADKSTMYYVRGEDKGFDASRLEAGQRIQEKLDRVTFYVRGDYPFDFLITKPKWVIVSDAFRKVIDSNDPDSTQFIAVNVVHEETKEVIGNTWALNILRRVEALDWEHTEWQKPRKIENKYPREEYPGLYIMQVALRADALNNVDVFRLSVKDKTYGGIFISDRMKREIEDAGATKGVYFAKKLAY